MPKTIQRQPTPPPAPEDRFLTTSEVAERYRTNPNTVRYWRHIGTGPQGTLIGRRVLYRESDLVRWEAEQAAKDAERRSA